MESRAIGKILSMVLSCSSFMLDSAADSCLARAMLPGLSLMWRRGGDFLKCSMLARFCLPAKSAAVYEMCVLEAPASSSAVLDALAPA